MLSVGFVYFCFLYIDIRLHIKKAKQAVKAQELRLQMFQEHMAAVEVSRTFLWSLPWLQQINLQPHHLQQGSMHFGQQIPVSSLSVNPVQPVSHRYCFVSGRHGSLVYLKFGAAWFCFGLLTHSVLTLTYQIFYLAEDSQCSNLLLLTVEIMFPLYSLFILFFIFKYCNIIINTNVGLARLMLMHAIGTSLAFWIYTIVRETQDAINMKRLSKNETCKYSFVVLWVTWSRELFIFYVWTLRHWRSVFGAHWKDWRQQRPFHFRMSWTWKLEHNLPEFCSVSSPNHFFPNFFLKKRTFQLSLPLHHRVLHFNRRNILHDFCER